MKSEKHRMKKEGRAFRYFCLFHFSLVVVHFGLPAVAFCATEPRPAWVDASPGLHGGVFETKVIVGPEATRADCEVKLGPLVKETTREYVAHNFSGASESVFDRLYSEFATRIVGQKWEEHVDAGSGESVFLHVQLKFDDWVRSQWQLAADRATTSTRTGEVIGAFGLGMTLVLVVHLALRFAPHSTKPT